MADPGAAIGGAVGGLGSVIGGAIDQQTTRETNQLTAEENAAQRQLQAALAQAGILQAIGLTEYGGQLTTGQNNLNAALQTALANQQTGANIALANQQTGLTQAQLNQQAGLQANLFNAGNQFTAEQINAANQASATMGGNRARTLNQLIGQEILGEQARGLEAAASRRLSSSAKALQGGLTGAGLGNSGLAQSQQRLLAGEVMGGLAEQINADQFQRANLASQLYSDEAFGYLDPTTGEAVNPYREITAPTAETPTIEGDFTIGEDFGFDAPEMTAPGPIERPDIGDIFGGYAGGSPGGATTSPVRPGDVTASVPTTPRGK